MTDIRTQTSNVMAGYLMILNTFSPSNLPFSEFFKSNSAQEQSKKFSRDYEY